jgi:hypothetical protein
MEYTQLAMEDDGWAGGSLHADLIEDLRRIGADRVGLIDPLRRAPPRAAAAAPAAAPNFEADNFEVLRRRGASAHDEDDAPPADQRTSVDLNDPANLADLEDPGLVAHMAEARERVRSYEPARVDALGTDVAARRMLSELTIKLKSLQEQSQMIYDAMFSIAGTLRSECADGVLSRYLLVMDDVEPMPAALRECECDLTRLRRMYETMAAAAIAAASR